MTATGKVAGGAAREDAMQAMQEPIDRARIKTDISGSITMQDYAKIVHLHNLYVITWQPSTPFSDAYPPGVLTWFIASNRRSPIIN